MSKIFISIYWFFSRFVNKDEKTLYRILKNQHVDKIALAKLCQKNFMLVCVFLEHYTKGYVKLNKRRRRKIYESMRRLEFELFDYMARKKLEINTIREFFDVMYLFLHKSGRYTYQESTFLGGMQDPNKLIGDCNQIVSLYVHLWNLFFEMDMLRIKLPKNHIVLNYKNIDIEATNGKQTLKYNTLDPLEVLELLTVNILDVSDFRQKQKSVAPRNLVEGFALAAELSSHNDLVAKNLIIAKNNLGLEYLKQQKFKYAMSMFQQTQNQKGINSVRTEACVFYVAKNKFRKALKFAQNQELQKYVYQKWVQFYVKKKKFSAALKNAHRVGMENFVLGNEFNYLASGLPKSLNTEIAKKHIKKIKRLIVISEKLNDDKNAKKLRKLIS